MQHDDVMYLLQESCFW